MKRLFTFSLVGIGLIFGLVLLKGNDQAAILAIAPAQACENLHKENTRCDCSEETCGELKECEAGYVACDPETPDYVCHDPGHEGEKCVYSNDPDVENECPPPEICGGY